MCHLCIIIIIIYVVLYYYYYYIEYNFIIYSTFIVIININDLLFNINTAYQ